MRLVVRVGVAFAALWCSLAFLAAGTSAAAEYKPATEPFTEPAFTPTNATCGSVTAYGGTDDGAKEVNEERKMLRIICNGEFERDAQIYVRLWWVTDELLHVEAKQEEQKAQLVAANEHLVVIAANTKPAEGGGAGEEVKVSNAAAISAPVAESVDASGESQRTALYLISGEVVALVAAYGLWKVTAGGHE
jgi:hypothetical protein